MTAAGEAVAAAHSFRPTAARLLGLLRPFRLRVLGAVGATCAFAGLNVAAPKYLGDATDLVGDGVVQGCLDQRLGTLLAVVAGMYVLA